MSAAGAPVSGQLAPNPLMPGGAEPNPLSPGGAAANPLMPGGPAPEPLTPGAAHNPLTSGGAAANPLMPGGAANPLVPGGAANPLMPDWPDNALSPYAAGQAGPGQAGSGLAGPGLARPGLAGPGLAGPGLARPGLAGSALAGSGASAWRECAVGVRTLALSRGAKRPLRTLIFYPEAPAAPGRAGPKRAAPGSNDTVSDRGSAFVTNTSKTSVTDCGSGGVELVEDAVPAVGRFPLVLFSHGLRGSPERYSAAVASWAAAGFVVAAPFYPHTNLDAARFDRADIVNQPRDAAYVIKRVRWLDRVAGDPLAGHIDVDRVAAVGHSAGGYTTTGLFVAKHPTWLRAGVVIAGWLAPGAFAGPPATMLFLQGDRDTVVPLAQGRRAYDAVPWRKSYVLLPDSWHADYMVPGGKAYPLMDATVTDFLRWTLADDQAARLRLPPSGSPSSRN